MTTDPKTYAPIFRAAANGAKMGAQSAGHMDEKFHMQAMAAAYDGIASMFEKMAEAEQHPDILRVIAERDILLATVTRLAAFTDVQGERRLADTGSYASFDEPGAVELARRALKRV